MRRLDVRADSHCVASYPAPDAGADGSSGVCNCYRCTGVGVAVEPCSLSRPRSCEVSQDLGRDLID